MCSGQSTTHRDTHTPAAQYDKYSELWLERSKHV